MGGGGEHHGDAAHGHGGGDFRTKVWTMSGGPNCRPLHWKRNTAIAMAGIFLVCIPIAMKSAELEVCFYIPIIYLSTLACFSHTFYRNSVLTMWEIWIQAYLDFVVKKLGFEISWASVPACVVIVNFLVVNFFRIHHFKLCSSLIRLGFAVGYLSSPLWQQSPNHNSSIDNDLTKKTYSLKVHLLHPSLIFCIQIRFIWVCIIVMLPWQSVHVHSYTLGSYFLVLYFCICKMSTFSLCDT